MLGRQSLGTADVGLREFMNVNDGFSEVMNADNWLSEFYEC